MLQGESNTWNQFPLYLLVLQIGKCHYFLSFTKEIHQEEKSMSYTIRIPIKFCNQQMHFFCVYVCFENRYNYVVPTYYMSGLVSYVILLLSAGIASTTVYNFNNFARIICMLCGHFSSCVTNSLSIQKIFFCVCARQVPTQREKFEINLCR